MVMVRAATTTTRSQGVNRAARSSVCWNMEREPTKVQYCFGFS